jgi:hypothetical protein
MFASVVRISALGSLLGLLLASVSWADNEKIDLKVGGKAPAFEAHTDADAT